MTHGICEGDPHDNRLTTITNSGVISGGVERDENGLGPGMKFDGGKPDWSLLDLNIMEDTVKVLTFGAKKYERDNWQKVENGEERYYAALIRHLNAFRRGEKLDDESNISHLGHAMCCLLFMSYLDQQSATG